MQVSFVTLLIQFAGFLNAPYDCQAFDEREDTHKYEQIADHDLSRKKEPVDKLAKTEITIIKTVPNSFILKSQFKQLVYADQLTTTTR